MNGYQRIQAALEGRTPDRVPIMLHNFMLAAREHGVTMARFRSDPRAVADSMIAAVEIYDLDGVLLDIDTATLAGACGVPVDFPENEPARCTVGRLADLDAVEDLEPVDISGYPGVQVWLEAVRLLRDHFDDEVMIRGNADQCPFSLASMVRGAVPWMLDLCDQSRRGSIFALLNWCTERTCSFVRLMAEAGAHMTSNGDSPAGPDLIPPAMYRTFALPYEKRVVACAHELGLPYVLHICGNALPILEAMVSTGADGLELDQKTDTREAQQVLAGRCTFFGNLDPSGVLARGTPRVVSQKTSELLEVFAATPRFVLNAGCAIPPETPPANIRAMVDTARSFG